MDEGTSSPAAAAPDISAMSFEQALAALEAIVQQLERGDVPLVQSITLYERGEALRAACQQRLDAAQARIERIVTAADGRAAGTRPFDTEG
ncbi:exodeoxyribonuclease VII small subunit [Porphyrobacter sp. CACIAM 03H1]|uniref:exodeoxyribonuclease VII small subunit n=1 Tax=Porphyrobacter sp. CACIAM 03H1 TaxID=2003315 RepID=UPI000B5ABCE0|nr:exodeoxyribonuclease VII small subunit [Porphyrobacter sp. CACIAM 03H1]ASJ92587.1 exodeoxyribonuclease VII small subunit [Porphyrobacter sp. CACIAM 03H1]